MIDVLTCPKVMNWFGERSTVEDTTAFPVSDGLPLKFPQVYGTLNDVEFADETVTAPPFTPFRNGSSVPSKITCSPAAKVLLLVFTVKTFAVQLVLLIATEGPEQVSVAVLEASRTQEVTP
jgi:hypothetical protein